MVRTIKLGILHRTIEGIEILPRADDDDRDARRVEFSFSSETSEVERYFGVEILGHKRSEIRLDRLNDGGAFLKDHFRDVQIGVVEKAWLDTASKMGRARARFSQNPPGEAERVDVADGIRTKISVGYLVHEMKLEKSTDTGPDRYRVTDWEPLEVSTVAIPADAQVGIGRGEAPPGLAARAAEFANHETRILREEGSQVDRIKVIRLEDGAVCMIRETDFDPSKYERVEATPAAPPAAPATPAAGEGARTVDVDEAVRVAQEGERARVRNITALGAKFNASDTAQEFIGDGRSFEEFRWELFASGASPGGPPRPERHYPSIEEPVDQLGLGAREVQSYSLLRAIRASIEKDPELAPREMEMSREIEGREGVSSPRGFYVPREILETPMGPRREIDTTGEGSVVATNLQAGSFIDILRNQSVALAMGATYIPGLVGNVDIPRQSVAGAAGWIAEGGDAADAELDFDLVQLTPKTIAGKCQMTRRLILQSTPAVEGLVRADLASALALGLDAGAIEGTGASNQPEGILNMTGIATVALGTNGAAMTWAAQVDLVAQVKIANAFQGSLGFVTNGAAWGHMMVTPKESGYPVYIIGEPGDKSIGRRLMVSEQIPSDLTKGTGTSLSAEIFGNWADLLVGEWGTMDIFADPYSAGNSGAVIVRAFQDADVAARHEESFAAVVDMVTT
jgi:HK97 family phage major capsid protein